VTPFLGVRQALLQRLRVFVLGGRFVLFLCRFLFRRYGWLFLGSPLVFAVHHGGLANRLSEDKIRVNLFGLFGLDLLFTLLLVFFLFLVHSVFLFESP